MNLKEIQDNAPDGATHILDGVYYAKDHIGRWCYVEINGDLWPASNAEQDYIEENAQPIRVLTEQEIQKSVDEMLEGNQILKRAMGICIEEQYFDELNKIHKQFFEEQMEKLRIITGLSQEEFDLLFDKAKSLL